MSLSLLPPRPPAPCLLACLLACLPAAPCLQEVRELISKCWSPNPEDRPPFTKIVSELESILSHVPRTVMFRQQAPEGGCCSPS